MMLNDALKHKMIEKGNVLRITDSEKDIIVMVQSISGTNMMSKDIKIFKGYCGNSEGRRGFCHDDNYKLKILNKQKNPEYYL